MGYRTVYSIIEKGKDTHTPCNIACFASYNSSQYNLLSKTRSVEIQILKGREGKVEEQGYSFFDKKTLQYIIHAFNCAGLKSELREEDKKYTLVLHEKDYLNKAHLRFALDCYRYIWEGAVYLILQEALNYKKKYHKLSLLTCLLVCDTFRNEVEKYNTYYDYSGHTIVPSYALYIFRSKDIPIIFNGVKENSSFGVLSKNFVNKGLMLKGKTKNTEAAFALVLHRDKNKQK